MDTKVDVFLYEYTIKVVNDDFELSKDDIQDAFFEDHGILGATSYNDAMVRLAEYYGIERICNISLCEYENVMLVEDIAELRAPCSSGD